MTGENPDANPLDPLDDATQVGASTGDDELDGAFEAAIRGPAAAEDPAAWNEPRTTLGTPAYDTAAPAPSRRVTPERGAPRVNPQPFNAPRMPTPQPFNAPRTPQPFPQAHVPTSQPFPQAHVPTTPPFPEPRMPTPSHAASLGGPRGHMPVAHASPDDAMNVRLARLAGLSIDRGPRASLPSTASRRRWVSLLPWILLVAVVGGGGYYHVTTVRRLKEAAAAQPQPAATPATATSRPSQGGELLASGYVAAKTPIVLSATSAGRLQAVTVEAGDTFKKGQVVAVISDGALQAELALAGARLRDASRQMARTQKLVAAQAATPADLERTVGAVEVARAEMRVTQQKIDETRIRSPINGTVLEVLAHPGEAITLGPNQSAGILRIADLSALIAEVDVAEAELKNVHVGQAAELTSESQRGHTFRGVVREIAEQADRARGTVQVKVDILAEAPSADVQAGSGSGSGSATGSAAPAEKPVPDSKKPANGTNSKKPANGTNLKGKAKPATKDDSKNAELGEKELKDAAAKDAPKEFVLKPGMAVQVHFLADSAGSP